MAERRPDAAGTPASDLVLLIGMGDAHGNFAPLFAACQREPAARALLQVGDLTAGKAGREQRPDDDPADLDKLPLPLVWVHGNHEHWKTLGLLEKELRREESTPPRHSMEGASKGEHRFLQHHLWPGDEYVVPETDIRVVGLPGNFAPTWYERDKPFPGDRVRHFNVKDVAALRHFREPSVLLMHESFRGQASGRIGAMGIAVLASLVRRIRPRVCLTGHHHALAITERGSTRAISLPRAQEGYMRLWFHPTGTLERWEFVPFSPP
jgi:hypothetical protein